MATGLLNQGMDFLQSYVFFHWKENDESVKRQRPSGAGPQHVNEGAGWACLKNVTLIYTLPLAFGLKAVANGWSAFSAHQEDNQAELKKLGIRAAVFALSCLALSQLDPASTGLEPFGFGVVRTALFAYAVFNPFACQCWLTHLEQKYAIPEGMKAKTNEEIAQMDIPAWLDALGDGSYSFAHLFKMVTNPTPTEAESEGAAGAAEVRDKTE